MGLEGILRTSIEFDPYSRLYSSSHITDKGITYGLFKHSLAWEMQRRDLTPILDWSNF